jgi:flagellar biogenesis protein FliO
MTEPTPTTGSSERDESELAPEEQPRVTGTLFLSMILLMIIIAIWLIMYARLLDR